MREQRSLNQTNLYSQAMVQPFLLKKPRPGNLRSLKDHKCIAFWSLSWTCSRLFGGTGSSSKGHSDSSECHGRLKSERCPNVLRIFQALAARTQVSRALSCSPTVDACCISLLSKEDIFPPAGIPKQVQSPCKICRIVSSARQQAHALTLSWNTKSVFGKI